MRYSRVLLSLIFAFSSTVGATAPPRAVQADLFTGLQHPATFLMPVTTPLAGRACLFDGSGAINSSVTTSTELGYLSGVTSPIQSQISAISSTAVTSVSATAPITSSGGLTPNISMPQASGFLNGWLSSADWLTFNYKALPDLSNLITTAINQDLNLGTHNLNGVGGLNGTIYVPTVTPFSGTVYINGSPSHANEIAMTGIAGPTFLPVNTAFTLSGSPPAPLNTSTTYYSGGPAGSGLGNDSIYVWYTQNAGFNNQIRFSTTGGSFSFHYTSVVNTPISVTSDLNAVNNNVIAANVETPLITASTGLAVVTGVSGALAINGGQSTGSSLKMYDTTGTNYVGFTTPTVTTSTLWALPPADGSPGQVFSTDGSGHMGFVSVAVAGPYITALTGDVTATGPGSAAATVNSVGGQSAATISSTVATVGAATSLDTPSTIVARDGSGNFAAGAITDTSETVTGSSTTALTVNTNSFVVDATNNAIGIGIPPATTAVVDVVNSSGSTKAVQLTGYGSNVGLRGRYANGTVGSPTAATAGNVLEFISGRGYGATGFGATSTGVMSIVATGTFTDASMPTAIAFSTTPAGSTTATEAMRIDSTGFIGIGTTSPVTPIDIVANTASGVQVEQFTGYGANYIGYRGRRAEGTLASPTAVLNGDVLNILSGRGYGATGFPAQSTGSYTINAAATFTDVSMPTYLAFNVTPVGSVTPGQAMEVAPTGNLLVGTSTDSGSAQVQSLSTTQPQLGLRYDSNDYARFQVDATNDLAIALAPNPATTSTGAVNINSAAGYSSSTGTAGGAINLTTGAGGGSGTRAGGAINLSAGSGVNNGLGGAITLLAGAGGTGAANSGVAGGPISITGGVGGIGNITGGPGGALSLAGGTGAGTTTNGGNGGATSVSGGAGGAGSSAGGNGGGLTLGGGNGGAAQGGAGGGVTINGGTGTSVGSGGTGGGVTINGGNANGNNTANQAGGGISLIAGNSFGSSVGGTAVITAGNGGVGTGATGGAGGALNFTGGIGGANATNNSGAGGGANLTGGVGGAGVNGGNGGAAVVTGGAGGVGSTTGGNGGGASLVGGKAAAFAGSNGGVVSITGGAAAAVANSNGGSVSISGPNGSSTGAGGAGGGVALTGGNAGGNNTSNQAGGAISLNPGNSVGSSAGGSLSGTAGNGGAGTGANGSTGGGVAWAGGIGGVGSTNSGNGGAASLVAGAGGAGVNGGSAGGVTIGGGNGGAGSTSGGSGGGAIINGGNAATGVCCGNGGGVTVNGGTGSNTGAGGNGGGFIVNAGNGGGNNTTNNPGGNITGTAGNSFGSSTGGAVTWNGGNGGGGTGTAGAAGGAVNLNPGNGGAGSSTSGAGGATVISSGNGGAGVGGGVGGGVTIQAGNGGAGSSTAGAGGGLLLEGGLGGATTNGAPTPGAGGSIIFKTASTTALAQVGTITNTGLWGINATTPLGMLEIVDNSTTEPVLYLKAIASQTADFIDVVNSTGATNYFALSPSGVLTLSQLGTAGVLLNSSAGVVSSTNGALPFANGGTSATSQQAAINALTGTQTSGYYLRSNGTNATLSALQAADITGTTNSTITTLSSLSLPGSQVTGNISGNAANVTGTVTVPNGGTGATSYTAYQPILAGTTSTGALTSVSTSGAVAGMFLGYNGSSLVPTWQYISTAASNPSSATLILSGTTFTTNSVITGATLFKFTLIGGGGGGAGNAATANLAAAGGGAGAVCIVEISGLSPSTGYTIAIGSNGSGGSAGANAGTSGGSTSITIGATTYTAGGGTGASSGASTDGGAAGTCTNATVAVGGENGGSVGAAGTATISGFGGSAPGYGPQTHGRITIGAGAAGVGYGSGGAGGKAVAATAEAGGNAAPGAMLVEWYN